MRASENGRQGVQPSGMAARAMIAAALSLILPGAGQVLIRRWGRAAIWFAGWLLIAGLSGSGHNAITFALMVAAAVDAFVFARTDAETADRVSRRDDGEA